MIEQIISEQEKNKLVIKYEPLVNKLTNQFSMKLPYERTAIKSMAYEGLAIAINSYDKTKSKMSFMQFAAFAMRNNILTGLDNELRTVKMSNYAQKKAAEVGNSSFNMVYIDSSIRPDDDDNKKPLEIKLGMYEDDKFSDGNVYEYIYNRLDREFPQRDCDMFYKSFGLNGYNEMKGKEIAKEFGVSEGLVSQKIKKIILYIKQDEELCEMLANLTK